MKNVSATVDRSDTGASRLGLAWVFGKAGFVVILSALLAGGLLASILTGSVDLSSADVIQALGQRSPDGLVDEEALKAHAIVWNLRLPRALLSLLVGLNLAVAGVLLQGLMRNALASPGIIGVMAGAALFATLAMLVLPELGVMQWLDQQAERFSYSRSVIGRVLELVAKQPVPMMAFIGAMLAAVTVFALSWQPGSGTSPTRMILAGVAVTAMVGAVQNFLSVYYADRIAGVVLWLSGSLNTRSWQHLPMIWPFTIIGLGLALSLARPLNLLQMGEDSARSLGVSLQRTRVLVILAAALLTASAVCVAGIVGFVGLVVPHIVRTALSTNHRWLIPVSALAGAVLVSWADVAARQLGEMPVGILTAAIGGPYFVFLLYKTKLI